MINAAYLAKGGDLRAFMAELYGKASGCAGGKGGSMHMIDMGRNVLGASAVVATTIPVSVGYALALKREKKGRMAASFFGDGATEEGAFYESLNFASLHKIPVLFVCENNGYAIHAHIEERWANEALCMRVESFGIPAHHITNGSVVDLRSLAEKLTKDIRGGGGPAFIECATYRWREHVGPNEDFDQGYRERAELEPWLANDQMAVLGAQLDEKLKTSIDAQVEAQIADAIKFAEASPWPEPEELYSHVYAD